MIIDLVYLWVDGSDPNWITKKNEALQREGKPPIKKATKESRWLDNQELMYSLRSVEKFAPWINHIFIATDSQVPKWLDLNHPKITIIDHKQFIPNEFLPLFNSTAIEMFLWNIPGLSEHFLYANDDMLFGKEINPNFFFDENENPIVIFKSRLYQSSRRLKRHWNSLQMVNKHYGIKFNISQKHAIEPFRKSYMKETAAKFYNEVIIPNMTPFRTHQNYKRMLFPLIDSALDRNTITLNWRVSKKRIVYNHKKDNILKSILISLLWIFASLFAFIKYDCYDRQKYILTFLKLYKPTLFCLNNVNIKERANFLKSMFPEKSNYEL